MRLLCLSNGHGEDGIAVRILQALQAQAPSLQMAALPIVGEGHAYQAAGIPLIGSVKTMPSGGFIYMDGRQLARDIRGGLLQLTWAQIQAIRAWGATVPLGTTTADRAFILAVGDIVPLAFAWMSRLPYAFVGTAKSEYYLRDEAGWLPRPSWWSDRLARSTGCVYYPWERWLMTRPRCQAVFPRDRITATVLSRFGVPAFDLGNPMMDGLEGDSAPMNETSLTIVLLPGSRAPEAYANWERLLQAVNGLCNWADRPIHLLAALSSGLDIAVFQTALSHYRWQTEDQITYWVGVGDRRVSLRLAPGQFVPCIQQADIAIAMAGTATEQFVGLGKPAITLPGGGPQFNMAFAEAQTRLLGGSVTLVESPGQVVGAVKNLLQNPDRLHYIAENGRRRMGEPGAADRIARHLLQP